MTAAGDIKTYDGTTTSAGMPMITVGSLAAGDTTTGFHPGLRQPKCRTTLAHARRQWSTMATTGPTTAYTVQHSRRNHQSASHHGDRGTDTRTYDGNDGLGRRPPLPLPASAPAIRQPTSARSSTAAMRDHGP